VIRMRGVRFVVQHSPCKARQSVLLSIQGVMWCGGRQLPQVESKEGGLLRKVTCARTHWRNTWERAAGTRRFTRYRVGVSWATSALALTT
jgi:hypothetical protein